MMLTMRLLPRPERHLNSSFDQFDNIDHSHHDQCVGHVPEEVVDPLVVGESAVAAVMADAEEWGHEHAQHPVPEENRWRNLMKIVIEIPTKESGQSSPSFAPPSAQLNRGQRSQPNPKPGRRGNGAATGID
jgi:hypothetical protein